MPVESFDTKSKKVEAAPPVPNLRQNIAELNLPAFYLAACCAAWGNRKLQSAAPACACQYTACLIPPFRLFSGVSRAFASRHATRCQADTAQNQIMLRIISPPLQLCARLLPTHGSASSAGSCIGCAVSSFGCLRANPALRIALFRNIIASELLRNLLLRRIRPDQMLLLQNIGLKRQSGSLLRSAGATAPIALPNIFAVRSPLHQERRSCASVENC